MAIINQGNSKPKSQRGNDCSRSRNQFVYTYICKIKEFTNQSPRNFIRNVRLKQAALLLGTETSINITEVAEAGRFCQDTHFSTAFKELFGVSAHYLYGTECQQRKVQYRGYHGEK